MKVRCVFETVGDVPHEHIKKRLRKRIRFDDYELGIVSGQEYVVYGVIFEDGYFQYYICSEAADEYPRPRPADLFEIVDASPSRYWRLSYEPETEEDGYVYNAFVIPDWAKARIFYEALLDGEEREVQIFKEYRALMDEEERIRAGGD